MIKLAELGKVYKDGEMVFRQGERGDCMYVVQSGRVEIILESSEGDIKLMLLKPGDIFGEMSLFTNAPRSATAVAKGRSRVLTVDKKAFLKRIHQDPSLAFRMLKDFSERIQVLDAKVMELQLALTGRNAADPIAQAPSADPTPSEQTGLGG